MSRSWWPLLTGSARFGKVKDRQISWKGQGRSEGGRQYVVSDSGRSGGDGDVFTGHPSACNREMSGGRVWVLFTNAENHDLFQRTLAAFPPVSLWPMRFQARSRVSRILREQIQLPSAARRSGVDVLWSPGYTAPVSAHCPQVVTVHDMQYCEFPEDLSPLALWVTRVLVPAAVRAACRVVTVSEFSRAQIVKHTGVPARKIVAVHSAAGAEFGKEFPVEEGRMRRARLVSDEPYILCVANTYPHKNVHALIEAFGRLIGHQGLNLVLVGGERRGEPLVRAALDRLPGARRSSVKRLRGLDRQDLVALYQGARIFAFPSVYEGFGLPVLEAMAAGVPVVAVDRGPMREIGCDSIRYCDGSARSLADQMEDLLAMEADARFLMIRQAREQAARFTWERAADQTVEVLRSCCAGDSARDRIDVDDP